MVHEDNEWGISLVSEDAGEVDASAPSLAQGIHVAYTLPAPSQAEAEQDGAEDETSLEELMKQMKSM